MRALVTGGGGFVGHTLVKTLLARGDDARIVREERTVWAQEDRS